MCPEGSQSQAEEILYGCLQGRRPTASSLASHPIDPLRLHLDQGGFMENQEYSGSQDWVVMANSLPEEWLDAMEHRYGSDQVDLVLTLLAIGSEGNPSRLIETQPTHVSYAAPAIKIERNGKAYWGSTDQMAAVVQLSGEIGEWYWLEKTHVDDGDGPLRYYLVYAPAGPGDFRNRAAGIVQLASEADGVLLTKCSLCDGQGKIPDQCDSSGWVRRGGTTRSCYGCNRCSHVMEENERECPHCDGRGRVPEVVGP